MQTSLETIIRESRTEKGDTYYNFGLLHPVPGTLAVDRGAMDRFWLTYCASVYAIHGPIKLRIDSGCAASTEEAAATTAEAADSFDSGDEGKSDGFDLASETDSSVSGHSAPVPPYKQLNPFGIVERSFAQMAVIADIDIKVDEDTPNLPIRELYTAAQAETVISAYQTVLKIIVDRCTDKMLMCVLLEKQPYNEDVGEHSYRKHGFHLHFPNLFMSKEDQQAHLFPRVQQILTQSKVFQNLGFEDSGKLIDRGVYTVNWLLYGSSKKERAEPYKVTAIYDHRMRQLTLTQAFRDYDLFDGDEEPVADKVPDFASNPSKYMPWILSVVPNGRSIAVVKRNLPPAILEKRVRDLKPKRTETELSAEEIKENIETAKTLLPMVSAARARDRNEWMRMGWLLYCISDGNEEGFQLWNTFSSQDDSYDEAVCVREWQNMTKKGIGIGTLRHYAEMDSPDEYKKFKAVKAKSEVRRAIDGSHNNLAKVLYVMFGDQFVCANYSQDIWYQYQGNRWEQIDGGVYLRQKISSDLGALYAEMGKELAHEMLSSKDDTLRPVYQARQKQVQKMILNLCTATYKNNIMKEAREVFYDSSFTRKLDADPYLIGFENGVFDLKLNHFRKGCPTDFLSKSMPFAFPSFTTNDPKVIFVRKFLEQIFVNPAIRRYFMDVSSDVFQGGNHQKIVQFWTGEGNNGKSIVSMLFEKMLGELSIKMNTNVLTGKKPSAGSANADLARTGGGVRLAVFDEPDPGEMINPGPFKHYSGNDTYFARDLYEGGKNCKEIRPMYKMIMICNKLPEFRNMDAATGRRIIVIPFETLFCRPSDPAPEDPIEQIRLKRFPIDESFADKIPDMVPAFCWLLLEHRKTLKGARVIPNEVRVATENYRKKNDFYKAFISERIVDDEQGSVLLRDLYDEFKSWHRESMPNSSPPTRIDVEEHFSRIWGPSQGPTKKWEGHRRRVAADDQQDALELEPIDVGDGLPMSLPGSG